ncbi:MAG: M23 family metallopeptidase [Dehalococcoidia bacterium]|nr:M23 family metallopeptidase [Dehalococcoidia bacterium]
MSAIIRVPALLAVLIALLLVACGGEGEALEVQVIVDGTVLSSPSPTAEAATPIATPESIPFTPTPPPSTLDPDDLRGFAWPLVGACLPDRDALMPNSPRSYRSGFHEGVDWYDLSSCARLGEGTDVFAMFGGVVVRADLDYADLTPRTLADLESRVEECACSEPEILDAFRGRQIWIDHGNGIVTRYAHLGSIDGAVFVGAEIKLGQRIGGVGESGTPESVREPGTEMHLHAEVRIGESFLGDGLPAAEVRMLWERLFSAGE